MESALLEARQAVEVAHQVLDVADQVAESSPRHVYSPFGLLLMRVRSCRVCCCGYRALTASTLLKNTLVTAPTRTRSATAIQRRTNHELLLLFSFLDKDGDGQVNRNDLKKALRRDPHVRLYLGLPAQFEHGSEEHAAYEVTGCLTQLRCLRCLAD